MTRLDTLIIGSGAAGLAAAVRLDALGVRAALYTEGLSGGTSANTGSDKQTYYKLEMDGAEPDSPVEMARDIASGGAVHGDIALVEAALSPVAFAHLVALGVRFPHDAYGRFVAVFAEKRFTDDSYVAVWESFDGLTFRRSGFVQENTCKKLHNCGISGRADGHIGKGDPVYLGYAYAGADTTGSWGKWATRLHKVTLSLADAPMEDLSTLTHSEAVVTPRKTSVLPQILTVKAEHLSYTISKSEQIWIMAFDADGLCFPILTGLCFDGYDTSVIRIVGTRIIPVAPGDTRVWVHWHGFTSSFVVHVSQ